jgi:hypothetical protein
VVFQKKVCLGTLLDPGGGGLPNPTESTMWGKGSSGRLLRREQKLETHERCDRTSCSVPTGADGVTRGRFAQYWFTNSSSESRRRASGRRDLLSRTELVESVKPTRWLALFCGLPTPVSRVIMD